MIEEPFKDCVKRVETLRSQCEVSHITAVVRFKLGVVQHYYQPHPARRGQDSNVGVGHLTAMLRLGQQCAAGLLTETKRFDSVELIDLLLASCARTIRDQFNHQTCWEKNWLIRLLR